MESYWEEVRIKLESGKASFKKAFVEEKKVKLRLRETTSQIK